MEDIFDILKMYGSIDQAISHSLKLLEMHKDACNNSSAAKMKPATTVYELVSELKEYFI